MLLVYLVIDDSNTFPKILDPWVLIFSDTLITYFRVIHLKLEDNFEPQLLCASPTHQLVTCWQLCQGLSSLS